MVITKAEEDVLNIDYCGHLGKSDHILLKITTNVLKNVHTKSNPDRYDFKRANYSDFKNFLNKKDWSVLSNMNVEEMWNYIHTTIQEGTEKFVPKVKSKSKRKTPAWFSPIIKKSVKKKHALFKRFLESQNSYHYKLYIQARNESARLVKNSKKEHQRNIAKKCKDNPKTFWNYVNTQRKVKENIASLWDGKSSYINNDKGKADALNNFFSSVFTKENLIDIPKKYSGENSNDMLISDLRITPDAVREKIKLLKPNKSPGPDQIFPHLLIALSEELSLPLSILFNSSIEDGELPGIWKHATVTPLFKKGSKTSTNNYRPVSLTSIVCKLLESFVRDSIQNYMEALNLYSDCQHGFRSGRSCVSQLLEVIDDFTKFIDDGIPFDVVYLDFKKAFDTVPHKRLLEKMKGYGIEGKILKWTESFLSNRTQQVKVNQEYSDISHVTSGIPQGSILGPILFTIFINDLPDLVNSICKVFADDTKGYNSSQNHTILQNDLLKLENWTETWQLFFNIDKCLCLYFGHNNPCHEYYLNSDKGPIPVKKCSNEKDLGVVFDTDLKFDLHVNSVVSKANQVLGLIKRNFTDLDESSMVLLFKSLIRPLLEYGQPVWSPHLLKQSRLIENVQRRATKLIHKIKDLPYKERLEYLKLPSLKYRRTQGDLIQVYKLFKSNNYSKFFTLSTTDNTM